MDFNQHKDEFRTEALKQCLSDKNIQHCVDYAEQLYLRNVPVIYNATHLSVLVGYKKEYLKKAALHTNYFYRDFEIPKKNRKKRSISEPLPSLKEIQIWMLKKILYNVPGSPFPKRINPKYPLWKILNFIKTNLKCLLWI